MSIVTITSNDTLTLNGRVFNDLSLDDVCTITYQNALVSMKTGKNGNSIFAQNAQGLNASLTLRLMRGSSDDQFLQSILSASFNDFPSTELLTGTFVKRLGDGQGNVVSETTVLTAGVISKQIDTKENVSGDVMQSESVYNILFANVQRNIG